jgi:predicted HicB family RNase H-like nuclease
MAGGAWSETLKNLLDIDGKVAVVSFDPDLGLFRGEFLGLSGGADFYGDSVEALKREGKRSLDVYLDMCRVRNIEPFRNYSGKFNVRLTPEQHEAAVTAAASAGTSLNEWIAKAIEAAAVE